MKIHIKNTSEHFRQYFHIHFCGVTPLDAMEGELIH